MSVQSGAAPEVVVKKRRRWLPLGWMDWAGLLAFGIVLAEVLFILLAAGWDEDMLDGLYATGLCSLVGLPAIGSLCLLYGVMRHRRRLSRAHLVVRLLLAAVTIFYWSLRFVPSEDNSAYANLTHLGMRARVRMVSDEEKLQQWAVELLKLPYDKLPLDEEMAVPPEPDQSYYSLGVKRLPDFVRRILPKPDVHGVMVALKGTPFEHIDVTMGSWSIYRGPGHSWGILVGPPSFTTENTMRRTVRQWRPGIYGYITAPQ